MRKLGINRSLRTHELNLISIAAKCMAHDNDEIHTLGESILAHANKFHDERAKSEESEKELTIANSLLSMSDGKRDNFLLKLSKFAQLNGKDHYEKLFAKSASDIGKDAYSDESKAINTIIAKIQSYPEDHELRKVYEPELTKLEQEFITARDSKNRIEVKISAERMKLNQLKLDNDLFRDEIYGKLISLTGREEAELIMK